MKRDREPRGFALAKKGLLKYNSQKRLLCAVCLNGEPPKWGENRRRLTPCAAGREVARWRASWNGSWKAPWNGRTQAARRKCFEFRWFKLPQRCWNDSGFGTVAVCWNPAGRLLWSGSVCVCTDTGGKPSNRPNPLGGCPQPHGGREFGHGG